VAISGNQNSKIKKQNDRAKFKNVVRGFSPVHDPEGSHYKKKACLAMTIRGVIASPLMSLPALSCHCERSAAIPGKQKSKVKDQNEEGFYILVCHFDFLCLIFNIVRDLVLGT